MFSSKVFLAIACTTTVLSASACWMLRDPAPWFEARHRGIARVEVLDHALDSASELQSVRLTDSSGLAVELTWRRAVSDTGRRVPLAVILGGHVRGRDAVRFVEETPGLMVAAVSYPFDGDLRPSKLTFLRQIPSIRRAFLDTPPALRLALDHLYGRSDVDTTRIEAIGVSLGAPFVTIAGALDSRFTRVWAIHGSGGSFAPLEANMRQAIGFAPARKLAAGIANVIISGPRFAPERWAARISPRPFVMVNAEDDERMPRASVQALYDGAAHPKEIIWMSGKHIHGDAPTIERLMRIVLERAL